MKKLLLIILVITMTISVCACGSSDVTDVHDHDHSHEETGPSTQATTELQTQPVTEAELSGELFTVEATGPLGVKHSQKIDVPFESEYTAATTDAQRAQICDKYCGEWAEVANRYINEILYYNGDVPVHPDFSTDEEMHEYVGFRKSDFVTYLESESRSYLAQMQEQYGEGDKADAMCAKRKFDLQRTFALEMIEIYELLGEFNGQEF